MELIDEKNYENLTNAIIFQAVKDYRTAVRCENLYRQEQLEKFFKSKYFKILSRIAGEELIQRLKTVKANKRKKPRLIK